MGEGESINMIIKNAKNTANVVQIQPWYQKKILSNWIICISLMYAWLIDTLISPIAWMIVLMFFMNQQDTFYFSVLMSQLSGFFIIVYLLRNLLIDSYTIFKKQMQYTIMQGVIWYLPATLTNAVVSYVVSLMTNQIRSNNQDAAIAMLQQAYFPMLLSSVLIAPIVEELIYRGIVFRHYRKYGFVVATFMSGVLFAIAHVVVSIFSGDVIDLLFLVPYFVSSCFMCFIYEKTKNLFGPIVLHMLNNLISFIILSLTYL